MGVKNLFTENTGTVRIPRDVAFPGLSDSRVGNKSRMRSSFSLLLTLWLGSPGIGREIIITV